jgi:protein phosphatase
MTTDTQVIPRRSKLALRWSGHSEVGPVRKNNQDSAYASSTMLLVADGMGGAAAGDLASAVVVKEMGRIDGNYAGEEMLQALAGAVDRASDAIGDLIESDPELDGMGATASGLMFDGESYGIVNIGDSRTYLFRDGALSRLTHDHSFVQTLVDDGRITEEESLTHPHRSLILRVINGMPQHMPDLKIVAARPGDRILVCSDGVCGMITDTVIEDNIQGDRDEVVAKLVEAVYAEGAQDNITILLADVVSGEAEGSEEVFGAASRINIEGPAEITGELPLLETMDPRPDPAFVENARYAPTAKHRGSTWLRVILAILVPLLVLGGVGWVWYSYTQQQYYVAADAEAVAIYQGVPEPILNLPLSKLVESTDIKIADLPRHYRQEVAEFSYRGTLQQTQSAVAELRRRAAACILERSQPTIAPEPSGTATPLPGGSASASPLPGTTPSEQPGDSECD